MPDRYAGFDVGDVGDPCLVGTIRRGDFGQPVRRRSQPWTALGGAGAPPALLLGTQSQGFLQPGHAVLAAAVAFLLKGTVQPAQTHRCDDSDRRSAPAPRPIAGPAGAGGVGLCAHGRHIRLPRPPERRPFP